VLHENIKNSQQITSIAIDTHSYSTNINNTHFKSCKW